MLIVSIIGSAISLVLILGGLVWLARMGQLEKEPMSEEEAAGMAFYNDSVNREPGIVYEKKFFKGKAWGASWSGEKSTAEIINLIRTRNWREGLPWATAALGTIGFLVFLPLFVLRVCQAPPEMIWLVETLFVATTLYAAWPRKA